MLGGKLKVGLFQEVVEEDEEFSHDSGESELGGLAGGAQVNGALESEDAIEDERRLFHVAATRARDKLCLTYPHMPLNADYGEMMQRSSRFLGELPKALLEEWQISGGF